MFIYSSEQIICYANIKCAVFLAGHDVNVEVFHVVFVDPRLRGDDIGVRGGDVVGCGGDVGFWGDLGWIPAFAGMTLFIEVWTY